MYKEIWKNIYKSICSITFLKEDYRIASGTGFIANNRLVTNCHVIQVPNATHVQLRFVKKDSNSDYISKKIPLHEFLKRLVHSEPVDTWDYAVFDLDWPEFNTIPSLSLCVMDDFQIGQSVVLFGYQFGQPNLSINSGVLASRFVKGGVKYLQIDANVNQGNSGGPLINPTTSEVIGIITRKHTGLTEQFDELQKSFAFNIQTLEQVSKEGQIKFFRIDPIENMKITQTQMAKISLELQRSANVGIGYAYELEKVRQAINI